MPGCRRVPVETDDHKLMETTMGQRHTITDIRKLYEEDTPISMVTCYDYSFARIVDEAGIDVILVGDSLGNVVQGQDTTLPVTMDEMVYHTRSVVRGAETPHIVADMPFLSYQTSVEEATRNAGRLLKEGKAQSVKLEGGEAFAPVVEKLSSAGIPVVGHLGLTPQSIHKLGGYSVQGKESAAKEKLFKDAQALQEAGAYSLVLEMVPQKLAASVTDELDIPTIGIGAGNQTSGQVLVLQDLLGLNRDFTPSFVKQYGQLGDRAVDQLAAYKSEVQQRAFPGEQHSFEG